MTGIARREALSSGDAVTGDRSRTASPLAKTQLVWSLAGDTRGTAGPGQHLAKAQICAGSSLAHRWKPTNEGSGSLTASMRDPSIAEANGLSGKWHDHEVVRDLTGRRSRSS